MLHPTVLARWAQRVAGEDRHDGGAMADVPGRSVLLRSVRDSTNGGQRREEELTETRTGVVVASGRL